MIHQSDWELLCSLHEYKNITKTANALYLTQPAVTKRLMQLEQEFGITIAVRHSKGLLFTPEGDILAEHAARMMQEYQILLRKLNSPEKGLFGTLHLAASSSQSRFFLPDLLSRFKAEHPNVDFDLNTEFSYRVSQLVNTQKAQVGFVRGSYPDGCERFLLKEQQACVVADHPFELEQLPDMPRINFYADQNAVSQIDSWWYDHFDAPPETAITVNSGGTCAEMVQKGLGYAIFLTEDFIAGKEGLYKIPLFQKDGSPIIRRDWMIWREETCQLDLVREFVLHTKRFVGERKDP